MLSLLVSVALLASGNSLLGTLISLRADDEGLMADRIGFLMMAYFIGYFLAPFTVIPLIVGIGRIRAFAAFASLISVVALAHTLSFNEWWWWLLRFVHGYSFSCIGIVVESWLVGHAVTATRGRLLAIYSMVTMLAAGGGQLMLGLSMEIKTTLFIVISILASLSLVPVTMSRRSEAPMTIDYQRVSLATLWRQSPVGFMGAVTCGLVFSAFLAMIPLYARDNGLGGANLAQFLAAGTFASVLLQYPLGWLSDRTDRRIVIILASFCAAVCAIFLSGSPTLIAIIFFSGFTFPLYALCISRANDEIGEKSLLSTAGSILLLFGLGAIPGPFIAGWAMQWFAAGGLFFYIIACLLFFILFTAYHLLTRPPVIIRTKKSHQTLPPPSQATSHVSYRLDPRSDETAEE